MTTFTQDIKNHNWETAEQISRDVKRYVDMVYADSEVFEDGPKMRITVTVEPIEDVQ